MSALEDLARRLGARPPLVTTYRPEHYAYWVNSYNGEMLSTIHLTQEAAAAEGRRLAILYHAEHVIHGLDGRIREKNSYGNDPRRIPG